MSLDAVNMFAGLSLPASGSARILYVEDDAGLARLLQKNLARQGYEVDLAGSGEEGLTLVDQKCYDVMLLDYNMPGCDGMEVVRTLSARMEHPAMIMVTGNGNEKIAVEAMKLGATDYIVKDVEMRYLELLPMVIGQVMQRKRLALEREQTLNHIRESEARYRKLVELSPDGIAICGQGRIEFVNQAAVTLLGAGDHHSLMGLSIVDFVHPDYRALFQAQIDQIEKSGTNIPWIEHKINRLDNDCLDVEVSGVPFSFHGNPAIQFIFRDITERVLARRRLEKMAHFDHLTGLPNRALFFDRLATILEHSKRYRSCFALLFLDLDRFKEVNDTLGHDKGDMLLKQVAERLSGCVRKSDSVARMGGDEFTVILSRINEPRDAACVAEKIIAGVGGEYDLVGQSCSIGCSVGISVFPAHGETVEKLLINADTAMYRAKEAGGNRCRYFED